MVGEGSAKHPPCSRVKITVSGTREEDTKRCATNSADMAPNLRKLLPTNRRKNYFHSVARETLFW